MFPINNNEKIKINFYEGPLNRKQMSQILFQTDIFIDASLMEGFGLTPLEAMAAGAVPIVSESFGIHEYTVDGENSFIIKEVNNVNKYIEKVEYLLENKAILEEMSHNAQEKAIQFDIDEQIHQYIDYFRNVKKQKITLTKIEEEESKKWLVSEKRLFEGKEVNTQCLSKKRKMYYAILKLFPKSLKTKTKHFLQKLVQE